MSYANANGIKIFFEEFGKGDPVILVHGFGSNRLEWIAQKPALSKKFKVIIFDNRGAGKSDRPNYPYTMEMFADDIAGLMGFLNIKSANIIGVSLGGMIVQNFILKYPHLVNKMVLISTFPGFPNQQGIEMYKKGLINLYYATLKDPAKSFFDTAKNGYTRNFVREMKENPKKKFYGLFSAEDIIKIKSTDPPTPQDIENCANAIVGHEVRALLPKIKNKTLIICAAKDKLSPVAVNEQIHKSISNSVFKIVEDVGHDAKTEKAPEINKIILDFLHS